MPAPRATLADLYNALISGVVPTPDQGGTSMGEMKEFAGIYYREGALDPKTLSLVALAAMAAAGCTS